MSQIELGTLGEKAVQFDFFFFKPKMSPVGKERECKSQV